MMCNDFDMFCRRNFDVEESTAGFGSGEGRAGIEEHLARGERVHTLSAFIVALVYAYTAMLSDSSTAHVPPPSSSVSDYL